MLKSKRTKDEKEGEKKESCATSYVEQYFYIFINEYLSSI